MKAWFGDPDQGIIPVEFIGVLVLDGDVPVAKAVVRYKGLELRAVALSQIYLTKPGQERE